MDLKNGKKVEDEAANTEEKVQFLDNKNVKFLRHDKLFKIVLFGDAGCGKTSLLKRYVFIIIIIWMKLLKISNARKRFRFAHPLAINCIFIVFMNMMDFTERVLVLDQSNKQYSCSKY